MITLRQHAISLAAVFLALAVGVILGSGLLNDTLLSGLREDKRSQQRQIEDLNQDKNALNEKLNAASNFDATMAPRMVKDALADRKVVLITTPEADRSDVDGIAQLISTAGGSVSGRIGLTDQFTDANQGERLRTIVNSSILPRARNCAPMPWTRDRRRATWLASSCKSRGIPHRRSPTNNATRRYRRCVKADSSPTPTDRWRRGTSPSSSPAVVCPTMPGTRALPWRDSPPRSIAADPAPY